jgi:hypothetical protein
MNRKEFDILNIEDRVTMSADYAAKHHPGPRMTGVVVGYREWHGAGMLVRVRHDADGTEDLYAPHVWQRQSDGKYGRDIAPDEYRPGAANYKAIETTYAGRRFRSRTEARWACYLDVLAIEWEYEAEGFHLSSGPFSPIETQKCHELADHTGCACLMLDGQPAAKPFYAALPSEDPTGVVQEQRPFVIANYKGCITKHGRLYSDAATTDVFEDAEYAVKVARSARFEHGETGPMVVRVEAAIGK